MKIVYLIGNGFDLNLGLQTAYRNFYDYYFEQPNTNSIIRKFKKDIKLDIENWADLEKTLGEYTVNFDTKDELDVIHKDLIFHLRNYLKGVENYYVCDDSQKGIIFDDLCLPEKVLLPTDKQQIGQFKSMSIWNNHRALKIITFNYTNVLEKLIGYTGQQKNVGNNINIILEDIIHIHGTISKGMALGVNDDTQFLNEKFREDRLLKNKYIKPELNKTARTGHDTSCQQWIKEGNLICVFGLSLGVTDLRWWQYIGDRLKDQYVRLILFYHKKTRTIDESSPAEVTEEEEEVKELFLNQTSLIKEEKDLVRNKIFVSINSPMFKIDNSKFNNKKLHKEVD